MKPVLGFRKTLLAWFNIIFGTMTALISLWALVATIADMNWKYSAYYLFGMALGGAFAWGGYHKIWPASTTPRAQATHPETEQ